MKASKYNTFFSLEGKTFGFNAYSQEYILVDDTLYDMVQIGTKRNDFSELSELHPDFYDFLVEKNFLVEKSVDEFEQVKELSLVSDNDSSQFELIVNPTMNCNFKCWYCYESHIKDSKMNHEVLTSVTLLANNVISHQVGLKKFVLSFFGGEPLLYFDRVIAPLLVNISAMCASHKVRFECGMTTNGLLIDEDMLIVCKQNGLNSFQITLDGNRRQHDKVRFISEGKGSFDRIVANIKMVAKMGMFVNVRVNCSSETFENIDEIILEFNDLSEDERNKLHFDFQKVWQEEIGIQDRLSETRATFAKNNFSVRSGYSDTVRHSCYADKRYQATVNYDGEVFKCTARDFVTGNGEGRVMNDGKIIWNEKFEKRLNSKFKNAPCKECRILPICGGGCTQAAMENEGQDYCVMGFDERAKTKLITDQFLKLVSTQ